MTTYTREWLSKGWKLFIGNFWTFFLLGLGYTAIIFSLNQSQELVIGKPHFSAENYKTINPWVIWGGIWEGLALASIVNILFGFPLTAGLFAVTLNLLKTGRFQMERLRVAWEMYPQIVLATFLIELFSLLGIFFCFIPTLVVQLLYCFTLLIIVDRKLHAWPAMEESRKRVQKLFWGMLGYFLASGSIGFAFMLPGILLSHLFGGFLRTLFLYLGGIFAFPFSWCVMAVAYRDLWPEEIAPPQEALVSQAE